ncbi:SH3 domain-containing protein [Streptomyces sp. NPDC096205]|uniref:SH3 domain-containing protein n=1 Tax=Streptomyces sp. NPDC096205 TaxID=3366081 RepID=UPI003825C1BE
MIRRAALATGAVTALVGGLLAAAPAAQAEGAADSRAAAVDCSWSWSDKDKTGEGRVTGTYPLNKGPYGACDTVDTLYSGTYLYYHCYVVNEYGNTWTHVRVAGTSVSGWVWDDGLDDGGSLEPC